MMLVIILFGVITYMYTVEKENSSSLDNNGEEIIDDMYENIEKLSEDEAMVIGKNLYDRATEIYKVWILRPYCGYSLEEINNQRVELLGNSGMGNGQYYKSDFSSLDYLKEYLKEWLSEDIVNNLFKKNYEWNGETYYEYVEDLSLLSGNDSHYSYVDYVLKDGSLYCRLDTGKGFLLYRKSSLNLVN